MDGAGPRVQRETVDNCETLEALNDLRNATICQRWGSGSLDQSGMPRWTPPLVRIQNSAPGIACCTCSFSRLAPSLSLPPSFHGTRRNAVQNSKCSRGRGGSTLDRKSTRLNSSHEWISYAVFCLKKKISANASL